MIALETKLDAELISEGLAREFVNKVQGMRKVADLDIAQRIIVYFDGTEAVREALERHGDYVAAETLAESIHAQPHDAAGEIVDLNGQACTIWIVPCDR